MLKTAAKVAVASHVHGKVQRRQSQRWAAQDAAVAAPAAHHGVHAPVAPPATPPAPPLGTDDMLTQLTRLGELRAAGVLTDEEFETQKARILG